ncbi:hypothetical protein Ctob_016226, partial [Chrysochromulina tobinii]
MHMYIVRGIGVAVRVSTSIEGARVFHTSFWATPNRCSSSTTRSPRFLKERLELRLPREHLDAHLCRQARAQRVCMQPGDHDRRHEEGGLPTGARRQVDGVHGHLRLPVAHVTAHEPVHGMVLGSHIGGNVGNGSLLVRGPHVAKPGRQRPHLDVVWRAGRADQRQPRGGRFDVGLHRVPHHGLVVVVVELGVIGGDGLVRGSLAHA